MRGAPGIELTATPVALTGSGLLNVLMTAGCASVPRVGCPGSRPCGANYQVNRNRNGLPPINKS
jgi:hypothetical protein